jgi:glucose/arabinose dehydrogenase
MTPRRIGGRSAVPVAIPRVALGTAALLLLTVAAGCGPAPSGNATPSRPAPSSTASPSPSAASSARPTNSAPAFDPAAIQVSLETVTEIPGSPLGVVDAGDGSGRLFVVSQDGRIWIVKDGQRTERPFLDISDQITSGGERGLLGLAFHPGYPDDPHFYVDYTDAQGNTVVSAWTVSSDGNVADEASERALLHVGQPFPNHNGGDLVFGPDGFLYITLGDGGSGGDPQGNGQNLDTLLGKILRIDVDHPSGDKAYGVPADNPFVERDGARPEIWLTGLRNPWRISFDATTRDLWIGDVGQGAYEEIDVVRAGSGGGQNFGWNTTEGFHCFGSDNCDRTGLTEPVAEYTHDGNCSVTGGYVYRGHAHTDLVGGYFFADYCSGRVWAIDSTADEVREPTVVLESGRSISSFGEDSDGELYVTDLGGALLRLNASAR